MHLRWFLALKAKSLSIRPNVSPSRKLLGGAFRNDFAQQWGGPHWQKDRL